jgi:hypothetical protein
VRKRQVKKFAKNAKKNRSLRTYKEAATRGSKKHFRRHRAFGRHWPGGLAFWDSHRIVHLITFYKPKTWKDAGKQFELLTSFMAAALDPDVLEGRKQIRVVRKESAGG